MTAVMGLDLSITATGVAVHGHTFTIRHAESDDRRLVTITHRIVQACRDHGITLAVIEDMAPARSHRSINEIAMVHGCIRYALLRLDVPYAYLAPATLKAYATGTGGGQKRDMAVAAYKRAGLEFPDDNQCDAWWLRQAGLDWIGRPEITMPQAQRARLDKGKWPPGLARKGIAS